MKQKSEIWLKFSGEDLDIRSIPIYELGDTLIAIQRIVHKTFLHEKGRLQKHAQLSQNERAQLSLQISDRRKSSDLYALTPFITDRALQEYLLTLMKIGFGSLSKYALKSIFPEEKKPSQSGNKMVNEQVAGSVLTGAIYAETVQITNHIFNIGNIEKIEIVTPENFGIQPILIDQGVQAYVREIANERFRGNETEIVGHVTRMFTTKLTAQIKVGPSRYVNVRLSEANFDFVRYKTAHEQLLKFKGIPLIKLGKDNESFQEFDAISVELTD